MTVPNRQRQETLTVPHRLMCNTSLGRCKFSLLLKVFLQIFSMTVAHWLMCNTYSKEMPPKLYCVMGSYKSTVYCCRCFYKSLAWPSPINWCHLSFTTQCYSLLSVDSTLKHLIHCFVKSNVAKIELSSAKCKILPQEVEVLILPRFLHKPIWYHLHSQKWPLCFWWWWV